MKTDNLNKTNLTCLTPGLVSVIEAFLGQEIKVINNYRADYDRMLDTLTISPEHVIFQNNYPCRGFRPFTKINRNYVFNRETGVLQVTGRDKWKRSQQTKTFQLEKVGYKLTTTHIPMGYIWGMPKLIS